jgi:3-deoxy-D-manno-octulosonic-acid transferase
MIQPLYTLAASLVAPIAGAWLVLRRRYWPLLRRFNPLAPSFPSPPVWVHACSVGEVRTAGPVLEAMRRRWPDVPILLTVSTVSGYDVAQTLSSYDGLTWFPFDHPLVVRRFVRRLAPRALVLIETELWPAVIDQAARAAVPIAVLSGRLSDRHFARYRRARFFWRPVLKRIGLADMQEPRYAERIVELGVPAERVHVTGNAKYDGLVKEPDPGLRESIALENGFAPDQPILLFGSTRPGDEALAAACWRALREEFPALCIVIAPRHLDRMDEALKPFDEPVRRRSEVQKGRDSAGERVFFLDTLGELDRFYALATVAVIGGSFYPGVEGQNPLEPAALGVPTVFGPHMRNFDEPARLLLKCGGACQVASADALCGEVEALLRDETLRDEVGRRGQAIIRDNQGAIERSLVLLEGLLS